MAILIDNSTSKIGIGGVPNNVSLYVGTSGTPNTASTGDVYFQNKLEVGSDTILSGNVFIAGNINISGIFTTNRSVNTTAPLTGGGNLSGDLTLAIPKATSSVDGYLSHTDFATFAASASASRNINTTSPLTGGGNLSSDLTIAIPAAGTSTSGYLTSTDWNTFNNKTTLPSLTAGSILFSNGTTIAQDNSGLFWDDTNNRIGINTTTPSGELHIKKTGTVNTYLQGTTGSQLFWYNNLTQVGALSALSSSTFTIGSGISSSSVAIIASQDLKLDAKTGIVLSGVIQVNSSQKADSIQFYGNSDANLLYLDTGTNNSVGIGTNNPSSSYKLEVLGNTRFGASSNASIVGRSKHGSAPTESLNTGEWQLSLFDIGSNPTLRVRYNNGTSTQFGDIPISGSIAVTQSRTINTNAPINGGGNLGSDLTLAIPAANTTTDGYLAHADWNTFNNKLTLPGGLVSGSVLFYNGTTIGQDSSNLWWDQNNIRLGIGTNAPAYTLHTKATGIAIVGIEGTSSARTRYIISNTVVATIQANTSNCSITGGSGVGVQLTAGSSSDINLLAPTGNIYLGNGSNASVVTPGSSDSSLLYVDCANNTVGVGIDPVSSYKFEALGDVRLGAATNASIVGRSKHSTSPSESLNTGEWQLTLLDTGSNPSLRVRYFNGSGTSTVDLPLGGSSAVLASRNINTTSPLTGGSSLAGDITLSMPAANTSTSGYLTNTDWNTFNGKLTLPSLTSGSVLFSNGSTIAQDNSSFFWDATNKRLGINTNTPSVDLHVKKATSGTAQISLSGSTGSQYNVYYGNTVVGAIGCSSSSTFNISNSVSNANMSILAGSDLTLECKQSITLSGRMAINASQKADYIQFYGNSDANLLYLDTSGTNCVGIGTVAGSTILGNCKLDIAGTSVAQLRVKASSGNGAIWIDGTGQAIAAFAIAGNIVGFLEAPNSSSLALATSTSDLNISSGNNLNLDSNAAIVVNSGSAATYMQVQSNSDANNLYIDFNTTNVGIGMSNASYKLDVTGDAQFGAVSNANIYGRSKHTAAPAESLSSGQWQLALYDAGITPQLRVRYNNGTSTQYSDLPITNGAALVPTTAGKYDFSNPLTFGNCQLWLDPYDQSTMVLRTVAWYTNITTTGMYLGVRTDQKNLNFATHSKFTFQTWVYFNELPGDTFGANNTIFGITNTTQTDGSWILMLAGVNGCQKLRFVCYTAANTTVIQDTTTGPGGSPFVSGRWYHIVLVFNGGAGSNDNQKLTIYVDGTALTTTSGTNLPSTLRNSTSGLILMGINGGYTSNNNSAGRYASTAVWDNLAATSTDVTNLWNSGYGRTYSTLPSSGSNMTTPTAYWELNETAGTRADATGNGYTLSQQSTDTIHAVRAKTHLMQWNDKSGTCQPFYAANGTTKMRKLEPEYQPDGGGPGVPIVVFRNDGAGNYQCMYSATTAFMGSNQTGTFLQNVGYSITTGFTEAFDLAVFDDTANNGERLFMGGIVTPTGSGAASAAHEIRGQYNTTSTSSVHSVNVQTISGHPVSQSNVAGNTYANAGDIISREFSCTAPDFYAWRGYINGVEQTVLPTDGGNGDAGNYFWIAQVPTATAVGLCMFTSNSNSSYQGGAPAGGACYIGDTVAHAPVLSPYYRAMERDWIQRRRMPWIQASPDSLGCFSRTKRVSASGGSAYTMTNSSGLVTVNSVAASGITLDAQGTWLIRVSATINYVGATYGANQTATITIQRTNNTATAITSRTVTMDIVTTKTCTFLVPELETYYTTSNSNDAIALYANVSTLPSAGSITISDFIVSAERKN